MFPEVLRSGQQTEVLLYLHRPVAAAGVDAMLRWLGLDVTAVGSRRELRSNAVTDKHAFIVTNHETSELIREHARLPVIDLEHFIFRQFDDADAYSVSSRFDASAFICDVLALIEGPRDRKDVGVLALGNESSD